MLAGSFAKDGPNHVELICAVQMQIGWLSTAYCSWFDQQSSAGKHEKMVAPIG